MSEKLIQATIPMCPHCDGKLSDKIVHRKRSCTSCGRWATPRRFGYYPEPKIEFVHTVQLAYTSPTGYEGDDYTTVAVFTSEERARLFVEWANRECKRIGDSYLKLRETMDHAAALKIVQIPHPLDEIFPEDDWGTRRNHFQCGGNFDLDPTFGFVE